jgi:MtrB/PioB family decaheme-associated outer membrane protein
MRISILAWTVALLVASSTAEAQYGASPSRPLMQPANPSIFGQIDFGGRASSIEGDAARYQRYRDLTDGAFFDLTDFYWEKGLTLFSASARNVGWKDQQYRFELERPGTTRVRFLYDQIPMFISRDTRTPYSALPGDNGAASNVLTLPDTLQAAIQANPAANFRPIIEEAAGTRFYDSRIRRDSTSLDVRYSFGATDATISYLNTAKKGNIPFGAYLQIPIEVPLPIDSKANDVRTSIEWATAKASVRAGWDGSWYDNRVTDFVWDNPQRAVDASNASSQGRLAEWPSNRMLTFNVSGAYRLPARTTVNGVFAFGRSNQDVSLLPFTVNSVNANLVPLPRDTAEAKANSASVLLNFVSRPLRHVDVNARYRFYEFDNNTTPFILARTSGPDRVTADGSAGTWSDPSIGKVGPEPLGHRRNYFDLDAGFTGVRNTTFRLGYSRYAADTHFRVYENVGEHTFRAGADVIGNQYVSFRSVYEHSQRRGGGLDLLALERAEERPGMRQFDVASRDRDRFSAIASVTPMATWGVNASIAWTKDDYLNETAPVDSFGLQQFTSRTYTAGLDVAPRDGLSTGISFSIEDYDGEQQSRTGSAAQQLDPARNWRLNEGNKAWSAIAVLDMLGMIEKTELRLSYNYADYRGTYRHELPANSPLVTPQRLPDIDSTEARGTIDLRYFLTRRVAVGLVYWYDRYDVSDFTLSPDVVSGVAQPAVEEGQTGTVNALLLNYFYRPFTAHTAWLRLTYAW